ncbi:MAG: DUF1275 domain-containing protein [Treponema sp.]|nr:DUF1275 domain-containing protein [Treponema sp.]
MEKNLVPAHRMEAHIHYTVAFIGGFLGLFPIVNTMHLFGSAQTANLINALLSLLTGKWQTLALCALGALIYALAVFLATVLPKHTSCNIQLLAMAVDVAAGFAMWRFPRNGDFPVILYLYPTFFAMPFQWCAFKGAYGFASSTIFSSNNFRQLIASLTEVVCNGDKSFALKACFFGGTLAGFHLGVLTAGLLWHLLGNTAFLFAFVPASVVVFLMLRNGAKATAQQEKTEYTGSV